MIKRLSLSGATLKYIAFASMFLDHFNKAVIYNYLTGGVILNSISDILDILGRIAFPIFAFISEVPYDMFQSRVFFNLNANNILFTFSIALATIWIIDTIKEKISLNIWIITSFVILILSCILSMVLSTDYEYYGILVIYMFYIFRNNKYISIVFNLPYLIEAPWSILGFGLNLLYNGERGKQNKYLNYMFYPLHLLLLGIIRMYLGI